MNEVGRIGQGSRSSSAPRENVKVTRGAEGLTRSNKSPPEMIAAQYYAPGEQKLE